jgi:acyl-CoA thioesterase-2
VTELSDLLSVLELEPAGEGRYTARNFNDGPGLVVFGGQLLAQALVAGSLADASKEVKSLHTIFARSGAIDQSLDVGVDVMHTAVPSPARRCRSARAASSARARWCC